jgi:hypothetical protein
MGEIMLLLLFGFIFILIMIGYGCGLFALMTIFNFCHWSVVLLLFIVLTFISGAALFTLVYILIDPD